MPLQHIVLFSFPRPLSPVDEVQMRARDCTPLAFDYSLDGENVLMPE